MKTVKEYAESVGKSHQAVYKQLKSKKNEERLKDHVWQQSGTTYLDDVAIDILNESRKVTQVKQDQKLKSENERMAKEINQLKNKIIGLQDEMKVKTEQMTSLLLENKEKTLRLEQKEEQAKKADVLIVENAELKAQLELLKHENDQLVKEKEAHGVSESQREPKKGFFARLFGR